MYFLSRTPESVGVFALGVPVILYMRIGLTSHFSGFITLGRACRICGWGGMAAGENGP